MAEMVLWKVLLFASCRLRYESACKRDGREGQEMRVSASKKAFFAVFFLISARSEFNFNLSELNSNVADLLAVANWLKKTVSDIKKQEST